MSKRTLLLADDSVTIQKVVNLTFADEGIEVITVGDGDSAMERISEARPDVVLADVHMPGLSGYQICEILRQNPATQDLPVVLLVGSFEPFDENEAARVGANAYLTKPFQSIRQLVTQVTDLIQASAPESELEIPQTEPEVAEEKAVEGGPDTNDVYSLYEQSVGEHATAETDTEAAPRYVDAGMDDEMIDASSVGEPGVALRREKEVEEDDDSLYKTGDDGSRDDGQNEMAATAAVATSNFDEFSRTEQIPAFDQQTIPKEFRLDEIEILELPPIENGKTLEFTTTQRVIAEGGKQVVSLSPELMDVIVQRVVEKLSEKY